MKSNINRLFKMLSENVNCIFYINTLYNKKEYFMYHQNVNDCCIHFYLKLAVKDEKFITFNR